MTRTISHIAARLALAFAGAGLVVSGLVLLLRALWLTLALPLGPIWASVVLGASLVLIGALILALSGRGRPRPARSDNDLIAAITSAFLQGLAAGRSLRNR